MAPMKSPLAIPVDDLLKETRKAKVHIQELTNQLTNPDLALSASVRLHLQKRELEAYLCGLLYALGERAPLRKPV